MAIYITKIAHQCVLANGNLSITNVCVAKKNCGVT